ncbi:MAG: homoserine kinase, partial [Armatimonadota bacterium]
GFDCLALALGIYNTFTVEVAESSSVTVRGEGVGVLHGDERNMFFQAYRTAARLAEQEAPAARVVAENGIPIARGLGSSAAAVIGGTLAANELLSLQWTPGEVLRAALAVETHQDNVVGALCGGLTASVREGEDVRWIELPPPSVKVILAVPAHEVPTPRARGVLPATVPFADAVENIGRAVLLTAALTSGDVERLRGMMADRLHQPYRAELTPGAAEAMAAAREAGALDAAVSGAGPTVIALATDGEEKIQRATQAAYAERGIEARCFSVAPDTGGAQVIRKEEGHE